MQTAHHAMPHICHQKALVKLILIGGKQQRGWISVMLSQTTIVDFYVCVCVSLSFSLEAADEKKTMQKIKNATQKKLKRHFYHR